MNSVLVFHSVTDGDSFEGIIEWLKGRYSLVPLASVAAFYAGTGSIDNACHISVDDGDRSFYDVMFPILQRHGVHASLFVSPKVCAERGTFWFQEIQGYSKSRLRQIASDVLDMPSASLGGFDLECVFKAMSLRQMNEVIYRYQQSTGTPRKGGQNVCVSELKEMAATGLVSVGAHTMNHPILRNEDDATCEYEIGESVKQLSIMLGSPVRHFAYPNGIAGLDFGAREGRVLQRSGIEMAFTTESRHLSNSDDALRIPRLAVSDKESLMVLKAKMTLGSTWNVLKKVKPSGEYAERQRLSRALSACEASMPSGNGRAARGLRSV